MVDLTASRLTPLGTASSRIFKHSIIILMALFKIRVAKTPLSNESIPYQFVRIMMIPPSIAPISDKASPQKCRNALLTFAFSPLPFSLLMMARLIPKLSVNIMTIPTGSMEQDLDIARPPRKIYI